MVASSLASFTSTSLLLKRERTIANGRYTLTLTRGRHRFSEAISIG